MLALFPQGLRVVELDANLLSGRLTGMLFADQGPNSNENIEALEVTQAIVDSSELRKSNSL